MELATGMPYLNAEIDIIEPEVIVALGPPAAATLLGRPNASVAALRGRVQRCRNRPMIVTFHPSYLIRSQDQGDQIMRQERRKAWEDYLRVMESAGMPISEKQRGFFR
jgi:DNA polymerase